MNKKTSIILIFIILLIDQISKIYIKTHFQLGEAVEVFNWFKILFIENDGMAWGIEIPGDYGKIILTLFRIVAIAAIGYWLNKSIDEKAASVLVLSIALILAGAIGNIIDSIFYGVIFDESYGQIATFFADQPYGELLKGKVVDMLYFPIYDNVLPEWFNSFGVDY
jgi:signal peptidase II